MTSGRLFFSNPFPLIIYSTHFLFWIMRCFHFLFQTLASSATGLRKCKQNSRAPPDVAVSTQEMRQTRLYVKIWLLFPVLGSNPGEKYSDTFNRGPKTIPPPRFHRKKQIVALNVASYFFHQGPPSCCGGLGPGFFFRKSTPRTIPPLWVSGATAPSPARAVRESPQRCGWWAGTYR